MDLTSKLARRASLVQMEAIQQMIRAASDPSIISLAGGSPAPEVIPVDLVRKLADKVLREYGVEALSYGSALGFTPLREALAEHMRTLGVQVEVENVMVFHGSQQAIDLLGRALFEPGDAVVVEDPTFLGAIQAFNGCEVEYITVPCDDAGPLPDELDRVLGQHPVKLVYLVPTFQNPSGFVVPPERRERLAEITARHGVLVIEDDPYGQLRYSGEPVLPLKAYDLAGNIIYMGTLSKLLSPGLRIGWLVAEEPLVKALISVKEACDQHTNSLGQAIAYEFLDGGHLKGHLSRMIENYRVKLEAMDGAMREHFPAGIDWRRPEGGMFIWAKLPDRLDSRELYETALERGVAFVPGGYFYVRGGGVNTLRLNFSYPSEEEIVEGIKRLGMVFEEALEG